jgi:gamma-glutamyl phosphate reductase
LKNDALLIAVGRIESSEGQEITLILQSISILDDAIPSKARGLEITLGENNANEPGFETLFPILDRNKGNCEVFWNVPLDENFSVRMQADSLKIQGSLEIEENLKRAGCRVKWIL